MALRRFEPADGYATLFERLGPQLPGDAAQRAASFERFRSLGFPNQRTEAWKYTNLKALAERAPSAPALVPVDVAELQPYLLSGDVRRLVFVNGLWSKALSDMGELPAGLSVATSTAPALANDGTTERSLTALNAALSQGGALIEVEPGAVIEPVIQLVFVQSGDASMITNPSNRVVIGAGARLQMAETHVSLGDGGFTNVVNHFDVAESGELVVDKLQFGRPGSAFVGHSAMRLDERAMLSQTTITCGGGLVRNESVARLEGTATDLHLNGAYMPIAGEHVDTVIRVEHRAPGCESNQFYKGILSTGGHGVFAGKIFVDQIAQKTNAYQQNDNLMLSRDSEIDTKPELEIYADDVKCSHGATVGELDSTGLFYLRSRGVDLDTAKAILTFAFAGEVIERLAHDDSRHQARRALLARLQGGEKLAELI